MRIAILVLVVPFLFTGCLHHHLRHNTVKQAQTVGDVQTQVVLDNLAKFAHNSGSLPHFTFASSGSTVVSNGAEAGASLDFSPFRLTSWTPSTGGSVGAQDTYSITPVNDPRKLELMACAYRKAVAENCRNESDCPSCDSRLNRFYLGTESPGKTNRKTPEGNEIFEVEVDGVTHEVFKVLDENGNDSYRYLIDGEKFPQEEGNSFKALYEPASVRTFTQSSGQVTTECIDSGWFRVCSAKECRKIDPCCLVGRYCDTCVVVPECHRDKLTRLTFVILDIAVHDEADPPEAPEAKTQKVVAYINSQGAFATSENDVAMKVTRDIPESTDLSKLFTKEDSEENDGIPNAPPTIKVFQNLMELDNSSDSFKVKQVPRKRLTIQPGINAIESRILLDANAPE